MLQRLKVEENQEPEDARRVFDHGLKTKRWRVTPDQQDPYADAVTEPNTPWWWDGEEEASSSFLSAMGVNL